MEITLNIGLNVGNTQPQGQLKKTVHHLINAGCKYYRIEKGYYQGSKENTVVSVIHCKNESELITYLQWLCTQLQQECISYQSENCSGLVYPLNFSGEKMKFDSKYFIPVTQTGKSLI